MRKNYNKLVRDRIPERLTQLGIAYESHVATPDEMKQLLLTKLDEEVAELRSAAPGRATVGEVVDIIEVAMAIAQLEGIEQYELEVMRSDKAVERGCFRERVVLHWTDA